MIDYGRLDRSIKFYEGKGFQRVEAPWTVTKNVSGITKPENGKEWEIIGKDKVLVASGEQGFLYLYLKGFLPKGRFQAITPCYRDEVFDSTHSKYFMKNELIITDTVDILTLTEVLNYSKEFFEKELNDEVKLVKTQDGFDLEYEGIEIGSYGIRSCMYLDWIYATGCAENRMSLVKRIADKKKGIL